MHRRTGLALAVALAATTIAATNPNQNQYPKNLTVESILYGYSGNGTTSTDAVYYTKGWRVAIPAGLPHRDGGDLNLLSWSRTDSMLPLQWLANPAVGERFNVVSSFPPNIDLHYSLTVEAAFTIQNFNPAIYGCQPFHPSPKYITPWTARWLTNQGWGPTLQAYERAHRLHVVPLPNPTKITNVNGFNYPEHTEAVGWTYAGGTAYHGTITFAVITPQAAPISPIHQWTPIVLQGTWVPASTKIWTRPDNVTLLKRVAQHHPFDVGINFVPGIDLWYGPDVAAAMTIQNFNPGSVGCQALAPSPKTLTPTTIAWLRKVGWGPQLARYAAQHHLTLPKA